MGFYLRKISFLAILTLIIANFLLGSFILATGMRITDKDIEIVKTSSSLIKNLVKYAITDNTLKTALNMIISGGEIGTDITYGLIVMTAINEMDFIDMVVSQRYKQEASAYFDQVINNRTNLMSYWKEVGYDLPRVITGYITGPIAGLTLNSFSITDKIISIFTVFNVIKRGKIYDGLWYYFSLRRENKMPHWEAWEDAKIEMSWAIRNTRLESQFSALWDKWGDYTDSKGVTETAKERFAEEMGQIISEAVEKQALAEREKEPSIAEKAKNFIKEAIKNIKNTAVDVFNTIKSAISQINPFGAGVMQPLSSFAPGNEETEGVEFLTDVRSLSEVSEVNKEGIGGPEPRSFFEESQDQLDDIAERIDILDAEMTKLVKEEGVEVSEIEEARQENEITEEENKEEKEEIENSEEKEETKDKDVCSVDINTASKEELQKITGVGPVIAQRMIEIRPFYSLNNLTRVVGIGEITLQKIIAQGCAHVSGYIGSGGAGAPPLPPPVAPPTESSPTYLKILISEIQISSAEQRFIELYNPNDEDLTLTDWYVQRKTETGDSWNSLISSTYFEGKIITSHSYFLIASSTDANIISDMTLTESNSLVLKNPNREIADLVGWGNAQDFETATATSPETSKSIGRKWATTTESYLDTENNQNDFELQTPTPKIQNQSPEPEMPQEEPLLTAVINEIAWAGTDANFADEWLELYNNSSSTIDLDGWSLAWDHATATYTINFSSQAATTVISGYGFYLIERTDDNTISDISADWSGPFDNGLNNDGEKLELRNATGQLIDSVDCSSGWFAGSGSPDYISMERINPNSTGTVAENWTNNNLLTRNGLDAAGNPVNATPKAHNSIYQSFPPRPVSDLNLDSQNSSYNNVALVWSSSTDPDTLSESLSYQIYYSREGIVSEENLNATSTLSTTTSANVILIPDLYYDSTYYFSIKVFDGQKHSSLSNVVSHSIPSALIDSPWQMSGISVQRSNQSQYPGPTSAPAINWIHDEDNSQNPDLNPFYTSPIIRPEGTIFSSVIYPAAGQGILALNPDGSKKSFQQTSIDKSLVLQSDGSVLTDDKKTKDDEDNTYLAEGRALKKIDSQGNTIWQRDFEFENPYGCPTSTPEATSPAIGENGIIYIVVRNSSCNQDGDRVDYLYLLSIENGILGTINLSGYRSSLPSVSLSGNVYISNLIYGAGPPHLYLTAASSAGEILWLAPKQIISNYDTWPPSPVLIDNQENLYFVAGKDVFGWNKDGQELWKVYLGESVPDSWYVGDIGIVLNDDGTLYLSGRGAILGLK